CLTPGASLQRILPVPASPSPADQRALDGVRVLLVEDTDDTRALLAFALEHCAAVVTTAASATEALESFQRDRPQILVTDLAMPYHDGYWLLRQVRALAPGTAVPAVALNRLNERLSESHGSAAGLREFRPA